MEHQFINALARDKVRAFSPDNSHSQNGTPVRERDRWQRGLQPGGLIPGATQWKEKTNSHNVPQTSQIPFITQCLFWRIIRGPYCWNVAKPRPFLWERGSAGQLVWNSHINLQHCSFFLLSPHFWFWNSCLFYLVIRLSFNFCSLETKLIKYIFKVFLFKLHIWQFWAPWRTMV